MKSVFKNYCFPSKKLDLNLLFKTLLFSYNKNQIWIYFQNLIIFLKQESDLKSVFKISIVSQVEN